MLFRYLDCRILSRFLFRKLYRRIPALLAPLLSIFTIDGFELRLMALAMKHFAPVLLRLFERKKSTGSVAVSTQTPDVISASSLSLKLLKVETAQELI